MKTDDLINALAADTPAARTKLLDLLPIGIAVAVMIVGYLSLLQVRPDITEAARHADFLLKLAAAALLAVAAFGALGRVAVPGRLVAGWRYALLAPVVLIATGVLLALIVTPPGEWSMRLVGSNALVCLTVIPALAVVPLAGAILVLRRQAPTRPAMAGALAGLLAAALAAVLYGTTCIDDSPLFVATWYSLSIGLVAGVGAGLGKFFLRW